MVQFTDTVLVPIRYDSISVDTIIKGIPDTIEFWKDSIHVLIVRDTIRRQTWVNVFREPKVRKIAYPVVVDRLANWSNWWQMTTKVWSNSVKGWFWLAIILLIIGTFLKYFRTK